MEALTLFWLDRDGERLGILHPLGPVTHREALRSDDTLAFWCRETPGKYDRVLWRDPVDGRWHEHVVVKVEGLAGDAGSKVLARTSLCDLNAVFVEEERLVNLKPYKAVKKCLGRLYPELWDLDMDEDYGGIDAVMYHLGGYDAMRLAENAGSVDFAAAIAVNGLGEIKRSIRMPKPDLGEDRGLRLTYAENLNWCRRTVLEADVYTRLYGYGAGMPVFDATGNFTGGYYRRLTMEEAIIDGGRKRYGLKYREDDAARKIWGLKMGAEKVHREGCIVFPDETLPLGIYNKTELALRKLKEPRVVYEADASGLAGGCEAGLGDRVAVVDTSHKSAWRLRARVTGRERVFGEGAMRATLTIGNVTAYELALLSGVSAGVTGGENATRETVTDSWETR